MALSFSRFATSVEVEVTVSKQRASEIAGSWFPVTIEIEPARLLLSDPEVLYVDQERIAVHTQFQMYDYRPTAGIALSETGTATVSGRISFNPTTKKIFLHQPNIDQLDFDRRNRTTDEFKEAILLAWKSKVSDPVATDIPHHPYLTPVRNHIREISYSGNEIVLHIVYK